LRVLSLPTRLSSAEQRLFRTALLRWFDIHRRQLPWRENCDPYRVWISEIMLQQTRVAAVVEHYRRFLARFPDVFVLARARQASVLAAWSGLGYYRRARLLHEAAREIVRGRNGCFPSDAAQWLSLPGIGRYTAAALASICDGERCAVVDGNVKRILQRLFDAGDGIGPQDFWRLAEELLSPARPGDFNQAMMELGAMVCTPKAPNCGECPVRRLCRRFGRTHLGPQAEGAILPRGRRLNFRDSGPVAPARNKRNVAYLLVTSAGRVLLVRRANDITVMPGMWELPQTKLAGRCSNSRFGEQTFIVRHTIMNTDYVVNVRRRRLHNRTGNDVDSNGRSWFEFSRAAKLPLTGLARKILERAGII
jgi:A/G-specific adenine glycosylase